MEVSLVLIDSKSRVTMIDSLAGNRQQQNTDRMIALQQQQQQEQHQARHHQAHLFGPQMPPSAPRCNELLMIGDRS